MGQVFHGCATTTEAVRRAIQHSQESLRTLAKRYSINQKTVAKWKRRSSVVDSPTGPKEPRSTTLSLEDEAVVVAFRRHPLLPLDDCLYAPQATIPHLTRSSLHRCLQRHGISRLPEVDGDKTDKRKFKSYPLGYFHIDVAEVRTEQGGAAQGSARKACGMTAEGSSTSSSPSTAPASSLSSNCMGSAVPEIRQAMADGEIFRAHAFEFACA